MIYFLAIATPSVLANNIYTIEKLSSKGLITISLSLPERNSNSPAVKLSLRNDIPISTIQISNVRCGNTKLVQDSSGNWVVPERCNKITWDVKAKLLGKNFFNIADQVTFKVKNAEWILFSESSSLLRINNDTDHLSLLVSHPDIPLQGATLYKSDLAYPVNYWLLPAEGGPPEFFVIGRPIIQSNEIGDLMMKYIIDDPNQFNWFKLQNLHKKILSYFAKTLPLPTDLPKTEQSLLVILVGSDVKNGQINGAAGRRSFIANYIVGKNKDINSLDN